MINYVYVWFANFRLHTISCVFSDVLIKYLFYTDIFSILISVWSFQCTHSQTHSFMFLTEWRWRDSNSWPPACKAGALPTELHPHLEYYKYSFWSGSHLLSHTVTSIVSSAAFVLTIVFGMWTGVSQKRIATRSMMLFTPDCLLSFRQSSLITKQWITFTRFP